MKLLVDGAESVPVHGVFGTAALQKQKKLTSRFIGIGKATSVTTFAPDKTIGCGLVVPIIRVAEITGENDFLRGVGALHRFFHGKTNLGVRNSGCSRISWRRGCVADCGNAEDEIRLPDH